MTEKNSFQIKLITPQGTVLTEETTFVVVPSGSGPIGILPKHAPLLGILVAGTLKIRDRAKKEFSVCVGKGFFMISHDGVTIVAQTSKSVDSSDVIRETTAKKNLVSSDKK